MAYFFEHMHMHMQEHQNGDSEKCKL